MKNLLIAVGIFGAFILGIVFSNSQLPKVKTAAAPVPTSKTVIFVATATPKPVVKPPVKVAAPPKPPIVKRNLAPVVIERPTARPREQVVGTELSSEELGASEGKFVGAQWREVATFTGRGNQQTENFMVSDRWRITWATESRDDGGGNFALICNRSNGEQVDLLANVIGGDSNTNYMRGGGTYYLEVKGDQAWSVIVRTLR